MESGDELRACPHRIADRDAPALERRIDESDE
jgi:hypothetical protein